MEYQEQSPYRSFSIEEWAPLRRNTPQPLSETELQELRGINERVSLDEVERVYLPLSRLLSLHVASVQKLNVGLRQFMEIEAGKVPFIIGIAGSVAVGKSTVARILRSLLARWPEHPKVDLISTDGFLFPTDELQARNLMHRKGFPESFDRQQLLQFLSDVKSGKRHLSAPVYSHLHYDIVPNQYSEVDQPDILIVEGLNVLQTRGAKLGEPNVFVSDYFDFSIYIDANADDIRQWYVDRFLALRSTVFNKPGAYFSHYASLDTDKATQTANEIWGSINNVNLKENILPTKNRAKLILHKGSNHAINNVRLRKL
ncbi:MAG: type I pantothenate kinase [Acidiferrobacterales bacterium]|nr:type I pantothenate kinase [Acidiferrobacterales bacterium]